MSRLFYHTVQDNAGNLLFDVSGTMRLAGSGTLATIYGDEALTVIVPNPMTNHPSFASFKCFLGAGDYDFYLAKSGYTFETLTGVQGHGTMAQQDADAVVITGGTAVLTGGSISGLSYLQCNGTALIQQYMGVQIAPATTVALYIGQYKGGGQHGIGVKALDSDVSHNALTLTNVAGGQVGSITYTATTTAYNTTSDARLKHAVQNLVGELAVIRALRPVRFRWNTDDSEGVGFLAQEVAEHVQGVITGEPDEVNSDGTIRPQMIDMSKLVPWIVGALQALAGQVETLTERVQALESALGV